MTDGPATAILHLEDSHDDAALLARALRRANLPVALHHVTDIDAFHAYLTDHTPDLIVSDYTLPQADGIEALRIAREMHPDVPFVFVSGTIGEERAVEALKLGATDYVLKDRLERMIPALTRALREREQRQLRRAAQRALEENHDLLRAVIDGTDAVIFAKDLDGRYILANDATARLLARDVDGIVGRTDRELSPAPSVQPLVAWDDAIVTEQYETTVELPDEAGARPRAYAVTRAPLPGRDGPPRGVIGIVRDITERKRMEAAIEESERRYRSLFQDAPVGLYRSTPDGTMLDVNPALLALLGHSDRETALETRVLEYYVNPEDRRRWQEAVSRDGMVPGFEFQLRRVDGATLWVRETSRLVTDADGTPLYYEGALLDFTRRHSAEARAATQHHVTRVLAATRNVEEAAGAVIESIARVEGWLGGELWTLDQHTRRLRRCGRWPRRPATTPRDADAAPGLLERVRRAGTPLAEAAADARRPGDLDVPHAAGAVLGFPVFSGTAVTGVLAFYAVDDRRPDAPDLEMIDALGRQIGDVIQRHSLEEQFLQAQKMEAIGRLAGGVAHDFNNLITGINGYTALLLDDLPAEDPRREDVEEIRRAAERGADLTKQLLAFSRRQVVQRRVVSLNDIVRRMDGLLRRIIGEDVNLVTFLAGDLAGAMADAGQIEQVIVNLAVNARDAMPGGGTLTIETATVEASDAADDRPLGATAHVCLAVTDTGEGMDEETQARIFEPFFTTKQQGKGTGLGLATVFGIVQQNEGHVEVQSTLGHGSTFRMYLPAVEGDNREPPAPAPPAEASPDGVETVLLVEDLESLRALVRRTLARRGYTVLEAADGEQATQVCRTHDGAIHIMVSDVVMPGMSGPEAFDGLKALRPDMRVLFMSGYADETVQRYLHPHIPFLQKPFTPTELIAKVREALDVP